MTYILRPYQEEAVSKAVEFFHGKSKHNAIEVLPTGSGKSLIIANIAKDLNAPTLIFQPSKEILEQNYLKLLSYGHNASIYSASVGQKKISNTTFATIGSISNKPKLLEDFKHIIVDECFIAGTKIDSKKIENIKVGDYVNSFNHRINAIEKKRVISVFKRTHTGKLQLTKLLNGSIISTFSHPFYVKGVGYVQANKLKKGDVLYAKRNLQKKNELSPSKLHNMWDRNNKSKSLASLPPQKNWADILFFRMWAKIYRPFIFRKNAQKKSDVKSGNKKESSQNIKKNRAQTANSRRQRKGNDCTSKTFIGATWGRVVPRISHSHETKKRIGISLLLQNRYSESNKNDWDRGRWWMSLFSFCTKKRQEKSRAITEVGVEDVSILEQRNNRGYQQGVTVYNLEVEGNNNYFAEDVLVHNCHLINAKNGMYKQLFDNLEKVKILGLTATPYRLTTDGWGGSILKFLTRTRPRVFKEVIYYVQNGQLFNEGYLAKLEYTYVDGFDRSKLKINSTGADYTDRSVQEYYNKYGFKEKLVETVDKTLNQRKNCLVFTRFISESEYVAKHVHDCVVVTAKTPKKERALIVKNFKKGDIKAVCNVGVLSTGFDHPKLESVVLARPTMSLALYYQMIGRGMRPHEDKDCTFIIDMCNNFKQFGKVEDLEIIDGTNGKWYISNKNKQLTNVYYGPRPHNPVKAKVNKQKLN